MAIDYGAIANDQARLERTAANSIRTLANLYAERAHFVYELLQNAEDALRRRPSGWSGPRTVTFHLSADDLRVRHFGEPFNPDDVQGICSVGETTKELTDIGRFGIGFKSVYAFTDRPEVHSGPHDFAIEQYVRPVGISSLLQEADETVIRIPLRPGDSAATEEITAGLQRLGARTLLFLRQVEEIEWSVDGGPSGLYLRQSEILRDDAVRRVTLLGQAKGEPDIEETWLLFSKPVLTPEGNAAGQVEVAFLIMKDDKSGRQKLRRVAQSPLVAFFPTVVESHLGFLAQGPYRTTPSRDNVPALDPWNRHCVAETALVVREALQWLRDNGLLTAGAFHCLPLERAKFAEGTMFAPLFDATKLLLTSEALLPRSGGGYASAKRVRLAMSQALRELLIPTQLAELFGEGEDVFWLSEEITPDRTPTLRQYLMRELEIAEVTPDAVLARFTAAFLRAQPDDWILRLYEFLNGLPALRQRALGLPLVRLTDGTHVPAFENGQARAFLPSDIETGFPTVRPAVCGSDAARKFLASLGLTEPDPVDDVVWNVLPKYRKDEVDVSDESYDADIRRILFAFSSDSKTQHDKLLAALRETPFVMAVDAADARKDLSKPGKVYLATERLKELFAGVSDVLLVDDRYSCLRGEDVRELLEACGAVRYLRPVVDTSLSWEQRQRLREDAGHAKTSWQNDRITDWTLLGLSRVCAALQELGAEERRTRARLLWEELAHLEERHGKGVFTGEYRWTHYGSYRAPFEAAFVRMLNGTAWIPDADGELREPSAVLFESLGWRPNPFLLSKIRFKPPIIDQLAKEAGFEPGVLDLLKQRGITSEAQLRELLGDEGEAPDNGDEPADVDDELKKLLGAAPGPTPPAPDPTITDPIPAGDGGARTRGGADAGSGGTGTARAGGQDGGQAEGRGKGQAHGGSNRSPSSTGGRPFISYVATHANDEGPDPDGLEQAARMALEAKAIDLIRAREPQWQPTPTHNPCFDLFEAGMDGQPVRWCEVKAMTGTLDDRPVGLSRTQFECAREHGSTYWLYVVEHAGTEHARVVRIQDPAGKARTFTFDQGWLGVAEVDSNSEERED